MKFDFHVTLTGICPELLCGIMTAERTYYEFGESMTVRLAGKHYVKSDLPKDQIIAEHIVDLLNKRLTENFTIVADADQLEIRWNGGS